MDETGKTMGLDEELEAMELSHQTEAEQIDQQADLEEFLDDEMLTSSEVDALERNIDNELAENFEETIHVNKLLPLLYDTSYLLLYPRMNGLLMFSQKERRRAYEYKNGPLLRGRDQRTYALRKSCSTCLH